VRAPAWRLIGKLDGGPAGAPAEAIGGSADGAGASTGATGAAATDTRSSDRGTGPQADTAVARLAPLRRATAWAVAAEPWLAPACALVLLLAPNPLVWPAAGVGVLPSLARLLTQGRPWRATPFDMPLFLLAIGAGLGGYASLSRQGALIRLEGLLAAFLLFAAIREHAVGERALRRLVVGLLAATVVSCLLLLVLVGPFLLLDTVPPLAAAVAAVDRWQLGAWFVDQDWLLQRYRFRASGVGALADVGLALAVAALVGLRGRAQYLAALSIPVFLLVLVVADNRGSMLAGALTLGMMATVWRRRLVLLVPVGALLVLLVLAVGPVVGPVNRGLSMTTLAQRFWFWENSLYLAREVPFTGAGLGLESVQLVYRGYFQPSYPPFSHAHNVYLQGLLEYGAFGLLGLVGLGLATLWAGWRAPRAPDRWTMADRLAGFGVALAMLTTGLTEIVLLSTIGGAIALGACGLLAATASPASPASPDPAPRSRAPGAGGWRIRGRPRLAVAACATVLVAGLAMTGLGHTIGARLLLNLGTADLNRSSLSETIGRDHRAAVLDRAVGALRLASSLDPNDVTIQRNLALALAASDDSRRGRAVADRAKALTSPGSKADLFQLGRAYVAVSAWGEAIRAWQVAGAGPQLIQLGNRLIRARNLDQATNAFIASARVDPGSDGAYDGIARAAREREASVEETLAALQPLLERDAPTEYGARLQAARVLREAGRLQDASDQLARAEELGAGADLSFELGLVLMAAGRPDTAEPLLVRPAADLPYDPDAWFWLARSRLELRRYEDAVATVRQGLERLDPSGQFAPPAERLPETAAVRAAEIKRSERAPLLGVMGESLTRLGRADEALAALDEAVDAAPKDAWLARARAEALAVRDGGRPNLLLNPSFARDGSWSIRIREWWASPDLKTLLNEAPEIADGAVRFAPALPESRQLIQDVPRLEAGHRYRLTLRLRTEGLRAGAVTVGLSPPRPTAAVVRAVRASEASGWTTVAVEAVAERDPASTLTVLIGFTPGTPAGATVWCDEAVLLDVTGTP
jgi:tetratricopeptide (TPR) repeat protein/O-antigen ligase